MPSVTASVLVAEMSHGGFARSGYGKDLLMDGIEGHTWLEQAPTSLES